MSPTWFTIKTLVVTFVVVSLMQISIGGKSLESRYLSWMKSLALSRDIQGIAEGGKQMSSKIYNKYGKSVEEEPNAEPVEIPVDGESI